MDASRPPCPYSVRDQVRIKSAEYLEAHMVPQVTNAAQRRRILAHANERGTVAFVHYDDTYGWEIFLQHQSTDFGTRCIFWQPHELEPLSGIDGDSI